MEAKRSQVTRPVNIQKRPHEWETGFPAVDPQVQIHVPREVQRCSSKEMETLIYILSNLPHYFRAKQAWI